MAAVCVRTVPFADAHRWAARNQCVIVSVSRAAAAQRSVCRRRLALALPPPGVQLQVFVKPVASVGLIAVGDLGGLRFACVRPFHQHLPSIELRQFLPAFDGNTPTVSVPLFPFRK